MEKGDATSQAALGFLTVLEHRQHGLFGGYLVLNTMGRPLEFHCTAPVKPNRAQEILYGPTLEPFLYGEQIGQTLLAKAKTEPLMVCTDREPVLAVRQHVRVPVAWILTPDSDTESPDPATEPWDLDEPVPDRGEVSEPVWRVDASHARVPLVTFQLGCHRMAVANSSPEDRRQIAERMAGLADAFDLFEPFGRIHEAIEEARRGGASS